MLEMPGAIPRTPDVRRRPARPRRPRRRGARRPGRRLRARRTTRSPSGRQIVLRHLTYPGARALGATTADGRLVGFVYGMPNDRTHWWSTVVEPYLRAARARRLARRLLRHHRTARPPRASRTRGIGRALITTITDSAAQPRSILSAIDIDSPARGLYRSLGYQDLARQVLFPSAPSPYAVMGAPLPLLRQRAPTERDFRPAPRRRLTSRHPSRYAGETPWPMRPRSSACPG